MRTFIKITRPFSRFGPHLSSTYSVSHLPRRTLWGQPRRSEPRKLPSQGFDIIDDIRPLEEGQPEYEAHHFYPVQLGEVFDDRYQTVAKLFLPFIFHQRLISYWQETGRTCFPPRLRKLSGRQRQSSRTAPSLCTLFDELLLGIPMRGRRRKNFLGIRG
jgi:hypothetical protein